MISAVEVHPDSNKKKQKFTSVGRTGPSIRGDRLYVNDARYAPDAIGHIRRVFKVGERHGKFNRYVARGITTQKSLEDLKQQKDILPYIEAVVPVEKQKRRKREHKKEDKNEYIIYVAKNRSGVTEPMEVPEERKKSNEKTQHGHTPLGIIEEVKRMGYTFTAQPKEEDSEQILNLWGPTFGWTEEEVSNFRQQMLQEADLPPHKKTLWFSGVRYNGKLVSIAMAEKLHLKGPNGKIINVVESTEWSTDPAHKGKNLMPATVALLNARIISDFEKYKGVPPVIIAECNTLSGAISVARKAQMHPPENGHARHILLRNTTVNDGINHAEGLIRDFQVTYLSQNKIKKYYNKRYRSAMTNAIAA